jgi:hypothetical protein
MKAEVYVNQDKSLSDLQTLIKHSFLLNVLHELLMSILKSSKDSDTNVFAHNMI